MLNYINYLKKGKRGYLELKICLSRKVQQLRYQYQRRQNYNSIGNYFLDLFVANK